MGQQQLLLLVLGIVIVGIAVVAGIQAFSEGKAKAQQDAAVSDAMRIISDVQAWKLKPQAFGGGDGIGDATDFTGVNLKALGYPVATSTSHYATTNGCFTLSGDEDGATISVYAAEGQDEEDNPTCDADQKIADVEINGSTSASINWKYVTG